MPMVSRIVNIGSQKLLDGGIADSIPLEYFEREGYDRNVVILTQPQGYEKRQNRLLPLLKAFQGEATVTVWPGRASAVSHLPSLK